MIPNSISEILYLNLIPVTNALVEYLSCFIGNDDTAFVALSRVDDDDISVCSFSECRQ